MAEDIKKKLQKYEQSDKLKYNLYQRSLGKPASTFKWTYPEEADGVPILARTAVSDGDPNVKIAYDNFASIQNEKSSYMASKITREYSDDIQDDVKDKYKDFDQLNGFNTLLHDMMVSCVGWGNTFSLNYLDDNNKVRMKEIKAWNAKVCYDDNGEPLDGYVYYQDGEDEKTQIIYHYNKTEVTKYIKKGDKPQVVEPAEPHGFTELPLIEWINNTQLRGNAQKSCTLIDAYDRLMSDGVTEWSTFRNAYLMLKNMGVIDEETKSDMQKTGVIIGDGENAEVSFVTKDVNPAFTELMLNRVWLGIWVVACSVDPVSLASLSNATAFQIAQMYRCMEQDSQNTEMRWQKSLEYFDRVVKSYWTGIATPSVGDYNTYDINYEFVRNLPKDVLSELEALKRAGGNLPQAEIFEKIGYDEGKAKLLAKESADELTMGLPDLGDE